ncbi:MAG: hypothetical protein WCD66_03000, partial [Rhodanobacteraceae bacterium]
INPTTPAALRKSARDLLAGYLPTGHPLLLDVGSPCTGTGWLPATPGKDSQQRTDTASAAR